MVRPLELDPKLETLLAVREDARGEIKARIEQRDRYSLQLLVGLGAIAAAALSQKGLGWLWLLAPVIAAHVALQ